MFKAEATTLSSPSAKRRVAGVACPPVFRCVNEKITGGQAEGVREFGSFFPVGNAVSGVPPLLAITERHRGRSLQGFQFPDALGQATSGTLFRHNLRVKRHGFTLIEVLLSLGLTVVLMLAVYTVFDLYQQVTVAGRADVERAQIVRAIVRKMELDLRSCVFQPPGEEESEAALEEVVTDEISTADVLASNVSGIVGDATSIVISTSRPLRGDGVYSVS